MSDTTPEERQVLVDLVVGYLDRFEIRLGRMSEAVDTLYERLAAEEGAS